MLNIDICHDSGNAWSFGFDSINKGEYEIPTQSSYHNFSEYQMIDIRKNELYNPPWFFPDRVQLELLHTTYKLIRFIVKWKH